MFGVPDVALSCSRNKGYSCHARDESLLAKIKGKRKRQGRRDRYGRAFSVSD